MRKWIQFDASVDPQFLLVFSKALFFTTFVNVHANFHDLDKKTRIFMHARLQRDQITFILCLAYQQVY